MNISYKWNHKTCCFSCSIMFARFIHVVACTRAPFLFYGYIITHCMYKHHLLLVYSSADKHLDCFHLWAIRNNAARNKTLCKFLCGHMFSFFLGTHPGAKLLGHMVTLCVNAWGIARPFSKVVVLLQIAIRSMRGFLFLQVLANIFFIWHIYSSHASDMK